MRTTSIRRERESTYADSLSTYLHEIRAYPLLSRAEEIDLARRIRKGDTEALDRLVCSNLRFVVSIAKKYQHHGVSLSDLINEGNIGLMRAAAKFDESKGVKFISYAVWWIRQAVAQALAENGHAVRVPLSRASVMHRVGRYANSLRQELGREPTQDEIAAGLDVSNSLIETAIPIARAPLSLDAPMGDGNDTNLLDYLADEDASAGADHEASEGNLTDSVNAAMTHLRAREAKVLRLYFGFDGDGPMTLESIGELLGITRERVRQIKDKALSRLRKSASAPALASLYDR